MPVSTYMVIDKRHEPHSLRGPRPDLSVKLFGTPNACNDCHADKSSQWAADAIKRWNSPVPKRFFKLPRRRFSLPGADRTNAATLLAMVAASAAAPAIAPTERS